MRVDIETSSKFCDGRTVCDIYNLSGLPKNCYVATKMDVSAFWDLLFDALKIVNKNTCVNN